MRARSRRRRYVAAQQAVKVPLAYAKRTSEIVERLISA
jgi:hypothetical protein